MEARNNSAESILEIQFRFRWHFWSCKYFSFYCKLSGLFWWYYPNWGTKRINRRSNARCESITLREDETIFSSHYSLNYQNQPVSSEEQAFPPTRPKAIVYCHSRLSCICSKHLRRVILTLLISGIFGSDLGAMPDHGFQQSLSTTPFRPKLSERVG